MSDLRADAEARSRIRSDLGTSLLVEAAAGTGKTTELVKRLVAVLGGGVPVERIAAVTFTNKAAGELKLRLRAELDLARTIEQDEIKRGHYLSALTRLEAATIGTFHSFCGSLLEERPVEAGLDPLFEALEERGEETLFRRSFFRFIQARLTQLSPVMTRALRRPAGYNDGPPLERLYKSAKALLDARGLDTPWAEHPFDHHAAVDRLTAQALEVAGLAAKSEDRDDALRRKLEALIVWARVLTLREADEPRDHESLEAELIGLGYQIKKLKRSDESGWYAPGLSAVVVCKQVNALADAIAAFTSDADANLAPALKRELDELLAQHETEKRRLGKVTFDDVVLHVRDLLRDNHEVRRYLQNRFDRFFVDELQDTDPLQLEILLLLAAADPDATDGLAAAPSPGKLFLVGDPKQSIYRFRNADLGLYERLKRHLGASGVAVLELSRSFRANRPIQEVINRAFSPLMVESVERGASGYVPLQGGPEPGDQPAVIALPVPDPFGPSEWENDAAIKRSTPGAVAGLVAWLIKDSGYQVRDPETGAWIPIAPRHVAILFRQLVDFGEDVATPYAEALERHGLQHLLVGARSFHRREEIEAMRAALMAIERPEDELAVYATLRGPYFALDDERLLRYRRTCGALLPWRAKDPAEPSLASVAAALSILDELSQARNRRPIVDTVNTFLARTRAPVGLAMRQGGTSALFNVLHLADLARAYEVGGGTSFRGFVERVEEEAETLTREGPTFEAAIDGVRLMTVHSAKGLEFPIVVLADPTHALYWKRASRHVDAARGLFLTKLMNAAPAELLEKEDEERGFAESEGVRLSYVAATRAKDLLVVPVVGTKQNWRWANAPPSWLSPFDKVLYPEKKADPVTPPKNAPPFGPRAVLRFPEGKTSSTWLPGHHAANEVTWWDPAALPKAAGKKSGIEAEQYLIDDGKSGGAALGRDNEAKWKARRQAALDTGGVLGLVPIRPSDGLEAPSEWNGDLSELAITAPRSLPGGKRFGSFVHQVLADVPLDAGAEAIARVAVQKARLTLATPEELDAGTQAIGAVLGSPLWAEVRAASRAHREYPVVATTPDGLVLDGILDLVFERDGVWTVVDWKTGLVIDAERRAVEEAQVSWYAKAIADLTGAYVRAILVRLAGPS